MLQVRPYESGDEVGLASRLKPIDVYECRCASGLEPLEALQESIQGSVELVTLVFQETVCGIAGVSNLDSEWYGIWLLTDLQIRKCQKTFQKLSQTFTRHWVKKYTHLCNWVAEDNYVSRRWLKSIGFTEGQKDRNFMGSGETFIFIHRSHV